MSIQNTGFSEGRTQALYGGGLSFKIGPQTRPDGVLLPDASAVIDESAWLAAALKCSRPTVYSIIMTPTLAASLLQFNTANRPLRDRSSRDLSGEMRAGRWMQTHEAIAVSTCGRILDGQHRLEGCVRADINIPVRIWFGEDAAIFDRIGTGAKRNAVDAIALSGAAYAQISAGAIRLNEVIKTSTNVYVSPARAVELHKSAEYMNLPKAVELSNYIRASVGRRGPNDAGGTVGLMRILDKNKLDAVQPFVELIATGLGITDPNDPTLKLRNKVATAAARGIELAAIYIKAWNAFCKKTPTPSLRYISTENFPTVFRA